MIKRYTNIINEIKAKGYLPTERTIPFFGGVITVLYLKQLVDRSALSELIIKPLMLFCTDSKSSIKAQYAMNNVIFADDCRLDSDEAIIENNILNGKIIILFSNDAEYIVVNLKKVEHRAIPEPTITYTIRGPRDCFVENLEVNLSLLRFKLKDENLQIDTFNVGKRSKTNVAVLYIKDIANDIAVNEIEKRIKNISTDVIWGTGEIQAFLMNSKRDLFPQMGAVERSDWVCEALAEGKVIVMADGGSQALIAPHTFDEGLIACDDRYDNKFFGLFSRILRYIALFLALCFSSIYIAIVSFNPDMLPVSFTIFLAQMRQNVLFPSFFEVLLAEITNEFLREALVRVPIKIGASIGIVGAIVIGNAATAAGIFSPLLLMVTSISLLSSFAIPDYFAAHPIRILKFLVIILTGMFGLFGFAAALTIILINLVSINSFGVPYMAPFAPFNRYDFVRAFFFNRTHSPKRPQYVRAKDETRSDNLQGIREK